MEASHPAPVNAKRGFFAALMDSRFDNLITPRLVSFLYVVSIIILALAAIAVVIAGFVENAGTGVLLLIIAPIVALIYLIVVRLYLELIVVAFKIRDAAEEIATNTRRSP